MDTNNKEKTTGPATVLRQWPHTNKYETINAPCSRTNIRRNISVTVGYYMC
jgi:hypothetical protein